MARFSCPVPGGGALTVSPSLLGRRRDVPAEGRTSTRPSGVDAALDLDGLYLSEAALTRSGLGFGDRVEVRIGGRAHVFTIAGDLL